MKLMIGFVACALALAFGAAHAQGYRWVDKDGKARYGDVPPPGVKATPMSAPASGPAPAPPAASPGAGAKDSGKGAAAPLSPEQAFKERQLKSKEASDKEAKDRADAETRKQNCDRAQAGLRSLQSGQRISQTSASGERIFLDDSERPTKIAEAQKLVSEWCK